MADSKISALPAATVPLAGTEVLPIVQSSTTRQVSVANLTAGRAISASSVTNSALTSGRVTYAGTSGVLQDSANFNFDGTSVLIGTATSLGSTNSLAVKGGATQAASTFQIGTDGYPGLNFNNASGGQQGYIQINTSTVLYVSVSDYRLKENVVPMTGALAKVAQLKPVTYKWKTDGSSAQGFIAHELQAVVPECVSGEKDAVDDDGKPKYQGIDTSFLVATLTAAIQEQQSMIASFEARLAALENK